MWLVSAWPKSKCPRVADNKRSERAWLLPSCHSNYNLGYQRFKMQFLTFWTWGHWAALAPSHFSWPTQWLSGMIIFTIIFTLMAIVIPYKHGEQKRTFTMFFMTALFSYTAYFTIIPWYLVIITTKYDTYDKDVPVGQHFHSHKYLLHFDYYAVLGR